MSHKRVLKFVRDLVFALAVGILAFTCLHSQAQAQSINEGFESLSDLLASGDWFNINHSDPADPTSPGWLQCDGARIPPAQSGTINSCVSADFGLGLNTATLNAWLIGPNITFNNGDTISFYTRESTGNPYPNRMQFRLSTNGASTDIGTSAEDVGDFTTLLLDINPNYEVSGYPSEWTQYTLTITGLSGPTSGRFAFRYFVENGGPDGDNSFIIGVDTLTYTPGGTSIHPQHVADFNGDGKTDYAVVRAAAGGPSAQTTWYVKMMGGSDVCGGDSICQDWGIAQDRIVAADFDGDAKTDIAAWRSDTPDGAFFYILESSTHTFRSVPFGESNDDPSVTADYTGDGIADPATYRDGTSPGDFSYWYYLASSGPLAGQIVVTHFGQRSDLPAPGDYDGDGKSDFCVRRSAGNGYGVFYIHQGTGGPDVQVAGADQAIMFGRPNDLIVTGDWDGDGVSDISTIRTENGMMQWFYRSSISGEGDGTAPAFIWGLANDVPAPGDYDGDGKTDAAIFRPNADPAQNYFYVVGSMTNTPLIPEEFGEGDDVPVAGEVATHFLRSARKHR